MAIEPYLFFNGRCEEAIEFYKKALGAEVLMTMRFKEARNRLRRAWCRPAADNKIMHTCMRIGDANVMASDGCSRSNRISKGFSLVADSPRRSRCRAQIHRARRRRTGADAAREDFLVAVLRHGHRSFRRRLGWSAWRLEMLGAGCQLSDDNAAIE